MLYNHLNLPRIVTMPDGETIEFTFDADGNLLRKQAKQGGVTTEDRHYIGNAEYKDGKLVQVMHSQGRVVRETSCDQNQNIGGLLNTTGTYQGDHIFSDATVTPVGSTIYKADQAIILNEHFSVETGKEFIAEMSDCALSDWNYEYILKDHLGSTRVVFDENSSIVQQNHTYPFGLNMDGPWQNTLKHDYNYLFNGKEMHNNFGWDMQVLVQDFTVV